MLRKLALAAFVLALPLATTGVAVPPGVNLHNGYVLITDNTTYEGETPSATSRVGVYHHFMGLQTVHKEYLDPHRSVIANRCCIVAGSNYTVDALKGTNSMNYFDATLEFKPRLCNIRGIPFGYAHFVLSGTVTWNSEKRSWHAASMHLTRVDTGCPESV